MSASKIRVLLVDDDEEDFLIASDLISEIYGQSYQLTWKATYDSALAAIDAEPYDVLIFDYRLGAHTGIELLCAVRERKYPAPVIMLTGQHDEEIDCEAIRLGASDYLIKGKITPDSFERSVRHAITHFSTLAQVQAANTFLQSIMDALSSEVAILNTKEEILAVNQAWRASFDGENPWEAGAGEQRGRLTLAGHSPIDGDVESDALIQGVRRVIRGEVPTFQLEFPCVTAGRKRWVIARVSSFSTPEEGYVVVAYEDITTRKLAELDLEKSRALLEELSIRDELTRLYNRRYVNLYIKDEFARSQRYGHLFALLILDIDHFKSVNDTYGHAVGDEALKHVASLCEAASRSTDCVARYGGEEFVFVLPETNRNAAMQVAERVRATIETNVLNVAGEDGREIQLRLTASIGVSVQPGVNGSIEALFIQADKGLYQAKAEGRNRVILYDAEIA